MRDAFEALVDQDPASTAYHHPDPASLAAQIAATGRRTSLPGRFRLAVAAAATASGVVTVALVAMLSAAPTLPLLAFAPNPTTFAVAKTAQGTITSATPSVARPVAGTFGPGDSLASAYQLMVPASGLTATMGLGAALGVIGTIGGYNGTVFTETSATGARVVYDTSTGLAQWRFQAGTASGPSPAQLAAAIARQRWGYTTTIESTSATNPVVVDGSTTTLAVRVTVRHGHVITATGPAFVVTTLTNYRLRSPTDALAALSTTQPTTATSVVLSWSAYTLADHLEWLLPTFVYHGHSGNRVWTGQSLAVRTATVTGTNG
ncbi:MAG: hypothetical protein ACYDEH_03090 [Acidimicrobiales bacterium]